MTPYKYNMYEPEKYLYNKYINYQVTYIKYQVFKLSIDDN